MSEDTDHEPPPFMPDDPESDLAWLPLHSPQDRLSYMTAKGVYDTHSASAKLAIAAATADMDKAGAVFEGVRFQLWTKLNDQN